jgi:two-component system chemotaxis response regulator CheB
VRKIRLAIVDDSSFVRKAIIRLLNDEESIEIVGAAATGEELIEHLNEWQPDVITLDLSMPGMGGLKTLDHIMQWKKIPVIILSTHSSKDAPLTIESLHRGAVDFIDKQQYSLVDFHALRSVLLEKIKQVTAKIFTQPNNKANATEVIAEEAKAIPSVEILETAAAKEYKAILIGASTGGPPAIQYILESLGNHLPIPVVIVQHMPEGFTHAFATRLNQHLPFQVKEASNLDILTPNVVYIAPAGYHLVFHRQDTKLLLVLTSKPDQCLHKPSVDVFFESAAEVIGGNCIAIILTGMGKDGAKGMLKLAKKGAYTIAQDESSCIVYGMPKAALLEGAIREIIPLEGIPNRIIQLLNIEIGCA